MIDDGILKLVFARNSIPDLAVEAFLSSRPGVVGAIGFQRIAESHADETKRVVETEKQLRQAKSAHAEFVNNCARIFHLVAPGEEVTDKQVGVVVDLVNSAAQLPVKDRPPFEKEDSSEDTGTKVET
ncbi:MAG: hypothetical protein ACR2O3_12930 [Rhizobiaceae bacterium]